MLHGRPGAKGGADREKGKRVAANVTEVTQGGLVEDSKKV